MPQARRAASIAVHRHRIPGAQNRADEWKPEERITRQKVDGPRQACADQGRVEETFVIRGEEDGAILGHALRIENAQSEVRRKKRSEENLGDEVTGIHGAVPSLASIDSRISLLVSAEVNRELLITVAPNGIISGATARWLSR